MGGNREKGLDLVDIHRGHSRAGLDCIENPDTNNRSISFFFGHDRHYFDLIKTSVDSVRTTRGHRATGWRHPRRPSDDRSQNFHEGHAGTPEAHPSRPAPGRGRDRNPAGPDRPRRCRELRLAADQRQDSGLRRGALRGPARWRDPDRAVVHHPIRARLARASRRVPGGEQRLPEHDDPRGAGRRRRHPDRQRGLSGRSPRTGRRTSRVPWPRRRD